MSFLTRCSLVLILVVAMCPEAVPQTRTHKPRTPPKASSDPVQPDPPQEIDTLKTDTNLVSVPVIATDVAGIYVPDLTREEFTIAEDGVKHEIAFFATVSAPFHVVLMLDTSASTQDKLRLIQQAARTFVEQLQPADRVKVISFDQEVKDHNEFTNDRKLLVSAISKTRSGEGTKLYDAMDLALNSVRRIRGRKAIVLFTDGVDWHSDHATFDNTLRGLDEEGVIVYPIRYDTRAQTERIAREQSDQPQLPTLDVIRRPSPGTTAPTFPSDDPSQIPTSRTSDKTGPLGLPSASEILRRRRQEERDREIRRNPDQLPGPGDRPPERTPDRVPGESPTERIPGDTGTLPSRDRRDRRGSGDSIDMLLNNAYSIADSYLKSLADKSGGKLLRADFLTSLPDAFAQIAAELRTQYLIGYYPIKKERDEKYRKIKVVTTRKDVVLRARPGYLATAGQ